MRVSLILIVLGAVAQAQTVPREPAFDVASVKSAPGGLTTISPIGQERFSVRNVSLLFLMGMAFGVDDSQIVGGPGWRDSEYFEVTAKAEAGVRLTYDELSPRLRELLTRRFKLAVHRETKEVSGYVLVVDKQGPKLKPSRPDASTFAAILAGGLRVESASMDAFAAMLKRVVGRQVTNETGLTGNYEISLDYAPEGSTDSPLPSIFTALQEQFGLRLDSKRVSQQIIVIDHVEHPTPD